MDDDRIGRLVNFVAPRSWPDALMKGVVFLLLINATVFLVKSYLPQDRPPWPRQVETTTLTALPFLILCMAILTRQHRLQQTLSMLATTDMLTGLPNRRAFMDRAHRALAQEKKGLLLIFDADHFKRINDQWGHGAGDETLIAIAAHLRGTLRSDDILGRLGGEEFAALLPVSSVLDLRHLEGRLCAPIEVVGGRGGLSVTLSVGAVEVDQGATLDRLMAQADRALYRAKSEGRARLYLEDGRGRAA